MKTRQRVETTDRVRRRVVFRRVHQSQLVQREMRGEDPKSRPEIVCGGEWCLAGCINLS
jgi:hypothetical protein